MVNLRQQICTVLAHQQEQDSPSNGFGIVAPPEGCEQFNTMFADESRHIECAVNTGFAENFTHSRIWLSNNAADSVWPLAKDWLNKHE